MDECQRSNYCGDLKRQHKPAFTGDVDTVAAIALAAGSCSEEISQDIPDHLITGLENGSYGRDYLIQLDKQLMSLATDK